ncbi:MAG: prenyltransferase [Gammaproteobacteria bacterium]|nr:prenyltransferase [Gammaproteobacteria bacterium]
MGAELRPAGEPTPAALRNPLRRYWLATRPTFLLASLLPVLIGAASAWSDGHAPQLGLLLLSLFGVALIHAGANVLNDFYDARSGTDALNQEYLHPYTGGSRFIQNGVLSRSQTGRFGVSLLLGGALCGWVLLWFSGWALLWIGLAGLLIAWAYSAPPLDLNRHGLGELSIALSFGLLVVVGSDFVQRQVLEWQALWLALPYGLLASALLYINQFPDWRADAQVGKRHWVVRLGPRQAAWGYLLLVLAAHLTLAGMLLWGGFSPWLGLGLLAAPLSLLAAARLLLLAERPGELGGAIRLSLAALFTHGLLLLLGLLLS